MVKRTDDDWDKGYGNRPTLSWSNWRNTDDDDDENAAFFTDDDDGKPPKPSPPTKRRGDAPLSITPSSLEGLRENKSIIIPSPSPPSSSLSSLLETPSLSSSSLSSIILPSTDDAVAMTPTPTLSSSSSPSSSSLSALSSIRSDDDDVKTLSRRSLPVRLRFDYPLKWTYSPLVPRAATSLSKQDIQDWLSRPEVRVNLFNNARINLYSTIDQVKSFSGQPLGKSPYFDDYTAYARRVLLPRLRSLLHSKNNNNNKSNTPSSSSSSHSSSYYYSTLDKDKDEELKKRLTKAATGFLPITLQDIRGLILPAVFPEAHVVPQPDVGNCYFCSIAQQLASGTSSSNVRRRIANTVDSMDPYQRDVLIRTAIQDGCPPSSSLALRLDKHLRDQGTRLSSSSSSSSSSLGVGNNIKGMVIATTTTTAFPFTDILRRECSDKDHDCGECLWGGNYLDYALANAYQLPVYGVGVQSSPSSLEGGTLDQRWRSMTDEAKALVKEDDDNVTTYEVEIRGQLIIPTKYAGTEQDEETYINTWTGPILGYLYTQGKGHIEALEFPPTSSTLSDT